MTALKTEFSAGAAAGNSLSGYRNKTIYDSSTNAASTIGASGAISFSIFRGKRSLAPPGAIATAPVISLLTTGGATVTWSVSANATSYVLSIGTSVGASNTYSANVGNVTSAMISATFLVNTSYFASVYGVNAAGNGTANQNATGYILCAAPTGVTLTVSSLTNWTITWTASTNATGYSWALSTSATNATSLYTGTVGAVVTTGAQTSSLSSSTLYYAFVYATRTESRSVFGSGSFTTPATPTVTAAVPTVSGNTITYTWTVSGHSSFTATLFRTTSSAASGGSSVATATTGTSATFTITQTGFYYTTITAVNSIAAQSSATSASALSATATPPPTPIAATPTFSVLPYTPLALNNPFPAIGTPITLINTGPSSWYKLYINLTAPNNSISYFTSGGSSGQNVLIGPNGTFSGFTIPGNIKAFGAYAVNTDFSQVLKVFTNSSGNISVSNPNGSWAANNILSANTGGPTLAYSWGTSSGTATSYTVNLYAVGNGTPVATLTNTTATSATFAPVGGTTYYTTVTATNAGGTSTAVQSANFTYAAPPVATVTTPTITSPPYTVLSANGTFPATGQLITLINIGTVNWQLINITLGGANKLVDNGVNYDQLSISTPPNGRIVFTMPNLATYYEKNFLVEIYNGQGSGIKITNNNGSISYFSYGQSIMSINTGGNTLTYSWGISSGTKTGYNVNLYAAGNGTPLATLTNTNATSATYVPVSGISYYTTVVAINATTGNSVMVTSTAASV